MVKIGEYEIEIKDEDNRYVAGWASVEIPDLENELVPVEELVKAMKKYMGAEFDGAISYGHSNKKVGKVIYWDVRKHPKTGQLGVYIMAEIFKNRVADEVWKAIKEGKIKGFSIGGTGDREPAYISMNGVTKAVNVIKNLEIHEISLADIPANPLSVIEEYSLAKSVKTKKVKVFDSARMMFVEKEVPVDEEEKKTKDEDVKDYKKEVKDDDKKEEVEMEKSVDMSKYPLLSALFEGRPLSDVEKDEEVMKAHLKDEIIRYIDEAGKNGIYELSSKLALALMRVSTYMPSEKTYKEGFVDSEKPAVAKEYSEERLREIALAYDYLDGVLNGLDRYVSEIRKEKLRLRVRELDDILKAVEEIKKDSCKSRYYNEKEHHFKGRAGTGERFRNCVKYFMHCQGLSEEQARAQCGAIARRKYGNAFHKALEITKSDEESAKVVELIERLMNDEDLTDEELLFLRQFAEKLPKKYEIIDEEEEVAKPEVPHVRDLGELIATFDSKEEAEKFSAEREGTKVVPTRSGRWAVIVPKEKVEKEYDDVKKPNDLRPPKEWLENCKRKTGSVRLCAWVYWHWLKPKGGKDDDPETREARERKRQWIKERVSKQLNELNDIISLITKGIEEEAEAIKVYSFLKTRAEEMGYTNVVETLDHIIREEKEHLEEFEQLLKEIDPEFREIEEEFEGESEKKIIVIKEAKLPEIKDEFVKFVKEKLSSACERYCEKKSDASKIPAFTEWLWLNRVESERAKEETIFNKLKADFSFKDEGVIHSLTDALRVYADSIREKINKEKVEKDEGVPSVASGEAYANPVYGEGRKKKKKVEAEQQVGVALEKMIKELNELMNKLR